MIRNMIVISFFLLGIYSFGQDSKYEVSVNHIMSTLECNRSYAEWVISRINDFSMQIQSDIEYIANSNESYSKKINDIPYIISQNFVSDYSKVDVSSSHSNSIKTYNIRQYLYRLSKVKKNNGYSKVELIFVPDYLGMGKFYKTSNNTYELSITMWQIFRAWFGENHTAYEDATRKKFRLIFYVNSMNKLTNIKVDRIFVSETIHLNTLKLKLR
jgi:hypothetical protein